MKTLTLGNYYKINATVDYFPTISEAHVEDLLRDVT